MKPLLIASTLALATALSLSARRWIPPQPAAPPPSSLASDDFNRSNGALGANWTESGCIEIAGNQVQADFCAGGSVWAGGSIQNNQTSEITTVSVASAQRIEMYVRYTSGTDSGYTVQFDPGDSEVAIMRIDAGDTFQIASATSITIGNGVVLKAVANGTTIAAYIGDTLITSVTDATYSTGQPGFAIISVSATSTCDNWVSNAP